MDENSEEKDEQTLINLENSFNWDPNSQLYYHPRSGFYHDPNAGWYYSTKDGLYYKFEDGNYVLLDADKDCQSTVNDQGNHDADASNEHATCGLEYDQDKQESQERIEFSNNEVPENHRPPSEWLEDTLIELYLSGYNTSASNAAEPLLSCDQDDDINDSTLSTDANNAHYMQRDGELSSDQQDPTTSSANVFCEEISWEEENWLAQYGQVVQQEDDLRPECPVVDIWDWSVVQEIQEQNSVVARLLGTLVKPSSSLHPSINSQSRRLKTAAICRVHLDLVQVRSGQVYKLRSPNTGYLTTLSSFDASNPTKEWGFPELSYEDTKDTRDSKTSLHVFSKQEISCLDSPSTSKKHKTQTYRDRAAERRSFQKEFGGDLGEDSGDENTSPHRLESIAESAAEALEMSFGASSYAQKILKTMGWKQGEGLGKTQQGVKEPIQGAGNKGTAGLGWPSGLRSM